MHIPELTRSIARLRDKLSIGSVGNLRKVKGYEVLMKVTAAAAVRTSTFHVVICGADYGELGALKKLRAELGLEEYVTFVRSRVDMEAIYPDLDLYVQSSHSDGMPTAILEGMAHGLPVVTTSVGGCGEPVVEGDNRLCNRSGGCKCAERRDVALDGGCYDASAHGGRWPTTR